MTTLQQLDLYLPHLGVGGGELSMLRLAQALVRRGVRARFVLHAVSQAAREQAQGIELISLGSPRTLSGVRALARHLARERPQALLSAFPHSNLAALAARGLSAHRCTLVLTEHAPPSQQVRNVGGWRYRALPGLLRLGYPRADAVVAVSQGVRNDLLALVGARIDPQVIYNPVLPADLPQRMAAPADHAWLHDTQLEVIMALSRLSEEKDLAMLLHAFAQLVAQRPRARLLIAGEGPQRQALQALAVQLGVADRCELAGLVKQPLAWLARAKAFALASRFEGFGNALVEAMACGLPVVSTDCPVGPREILQGGRLGTLVPVGDARAMAAALGQALDAGAPPGAREFALQFTEDRAAQGYLQLIESLLARQQVRSAPC